MTSHDCQLFMTILVLLFAFIIRWRIITAAHVIPISWIVLLNCSSCNGRMFNSFFDGIFDVIIISTVLTDDTIQNWANTAKCNESTDNCSSVVLNIIWRIFIVAIFSIVKVITITIVINHEIKSGIVSDCAIIIEWSVVNIQRMVCSTCL